MLRTLIGLALGSGIGTVTGYFGQCASGTCPLTSTWWRGAIWGGLLWLAIAWSWTRS
jgi:hypothetical protein